MSRRTTASQRHLRPKRANVTHTSHTPHQPERNACNMPRERSRAPSTLAHNRQLRVKRSMVGKISKGRIGREKTPTYILVKSPMSRRHLDLFHMTICHMGFQTAHSPPSMFQLTPEPVWNESRPSSNTLFLPSGTHC